MKTMLSCIVVIEAPHAGLVRIDVVELEVEEGQDRCRYDFRLVSSIPNPPVIEVDSWRYETPEEAAEAALVLLQKHCEVRAVYPKAGVGLREAIGSAWVGLEIGTNAQAHLKTIVRWVLEGLHRSIPGLISRGLVDSSKAVDVYEALRYFALTDIVGFPSDFVPDPWLDRLSTPLLVELARANGALADLYKAEVLRRNGDIARWEFVRIGPYEARVNIISLRRFKVIPQTSDEMPLLAPKDVN